MFYNLILQVNSFDIRHHTTSGTGTDGAYYTNQYGEKIRRMGQARLKSLELIHSILLLLYPSAGALIKAGSALSGNTPGVAPHPDFEMDKYVSKTMRRQLVKTVLVVMREYSYCSIGN